VFLSTDKGTSWGPVSSGLTEFVIRSLIVSGTSLFAGTTGGIFVTSDKGASWTRINEGLENVNILSLAVMGTDLFAGTFGAGVWQRTLSEMVVSVPPSEGRLPDAVDLFQNYPNPFNPSTTIEYALPQRSYVTLAVFDALGQRVVTLVQGEKDAGYHRAVFDAAGLASGVYLYRLEIRTRDTATGRESGSGSGDFVRTRKLVLVH
jgi:hypothetical protein